MVCGYPPAVADQMADERHHVFDIGQAGLLNGDSAAAVLW